MQHQLPVQISLTQNIKTKVCFINCSEIPCARNIEVSLGLWGYLGVFERIKIVMPLLSLKAEIVR